MSLCLSLIHISENRKLGDVTTLANQDVVEEIAKQAAQNTED